MLEQKNLRTAFDLLDRDQDGHVTPEELQFMLRNLGIHVRDELIDDLLREASRTARLAPLRRDCERCIHFSGTNEHWNATVSISSTQQEL
uniref:EF-hand domain-containing protein n=1 Tax=Anopheles quadriannulatus TaxID=34691 RepID=A0A182XD03_ANOQN